MPAYRDGRSGVWRYRKRVRMPDGSRPRIEGTPPLNTKLAAEQAEKGAHRAPPSRRADQNQERGAHVRGVRQDLHGDLRAQQQQTQRVRGQTIDPHPPSCPAFGARPLDEITGKDVEDLKARLLDTKRSAKRINNVLNVLSKILRYAFEIELLDRMPRIKTLRAGLKRQAKGAGLRVTGWHVLRHTFCSHLAMRGAPAIAIKELAGHASIAVTNRYMHLAPGGATRNAIALLETGRQVGDSAENLA